MKILVIDDDYLVAFSLQKVLNKLGYETEICTEAGKSFDFIKSFQPDVILLDIYLTTHDGLDLLKEIQSSYFQMPVIMITGYSDVNIAVKAMKLGAMDFLLKPIDLEQLQLTLKKCFDNLFLKYENQKLHEILSSDKLSPGFFGKGKVIARILNLVEKLSKSDSTTILIQGESGTGKEMIAKYIHQNSPRRDKVFITINCGTIPRELAESELFGHEKGAFTGAAQKTKLGKFELADGGTLLLDEIGELSLDLQVKLLRVLQERKFYRLGGEREISVDVRVLAASNKDLETEAKKGTFREDLLYRLDVAKVVIPPLRERKEDIPYLINIFIEEFSHKFSKRVRGIDDEAVKLLTEQFWRGNVRELRNAMERAMLMVETDELKVPSFSFLKREEDKKDSGDSFELKIPKAGIKIEAVLRSLILQTLEITKGNQVKAAKVLGLSRSKLRYRMEQLGIEVTKSIQ